MGGLLQTREMLSLFIEYIRRVREVFWTPTAESKMGEEGNAKQFPRGEASPSPQPPFLPLVNIAIVNNRVVLRRTEQEKDSGERGNAGTVLFLYRRASVVRNQCRKRTLYRMI